MTSNIDRFQNDLNKNIELGNDLHFAMLIELYGEDRFLESNKDNENLELLKERIKILPKFKKYYEMWYSESIVLINQLLPDRSQDFKSLYEKPRIRKTLDAGTYVIQDYLQGIAVSLNGKEIVGPSAALSQFEQQLSIVEAAKVRFSSSLFDIRQLVQADLLDGELEAARALVKAKFIRAAGALCGVVIERHLKQVCVDHGIKIAKKHPTISDLNEALKANDVIDQPQWRHITLLADYRNLCDHAKSSEPTAEQVKDLVDGAEKVVHTIF